MSEDRCQETEGRRRGWKLDLGIRKFDWKAQIREAENRLTHRCRLLQRGMKEIIRIQLNV